jgi:LPS-assembly protein
VHYQPPTTTPTNPTRPPSAQKLISFGYNFVRNGDLLPGEKPGDLAANLSSTDVSFDWPVLRDWSALGRWTQNWNHHHFQNLLYGLQYDSCCWAVRFIAGRAFMGLGPNTAFQYNTQFFIQFALKGLGTVPVHGGDPNQMLAANISGITNNFGRDF